MPKANFGVTFAGAVGLAGSQFQAAAAWSPGFGEVAMVEGALAVWHLLTAASIAFMVYDLATNTPAMGVMKAAWILITLYLGPIGLFIYLLSCRQPMPGTHDAFTAAHWKQSIGSLAHCLAGDATGIILGAILTYRFGFPNGMDLILEYAAAFLFGWMIFQALFMRSMMSGSYSLALPKTFFAEFVSMNMVIVGMIPSMVILMYALPQSRSPLHPLFWGVMSLAALAGGFTAYPVNSWMVRRGIKHGMMSAPRKGASAMPGMKMRGMEAPVPASGGSHAHHAAPAGLGRQAFIAALTLAALAAAVWLTAHIAPIRLLADPARELAAA
ncbi:MAG: DUF4396 domain-containing protein [Beijerinckiaceae bacterium]|nr:DUF4396 domain-containing protein [Beijerinckiaceae bacterium]